MQPNFCSFCGVQLPHEQQEARHPHCTVCDTTHWQNAKPVAVLLQPVFMPEGAFGLVAGVRNIEPRKGGLALPSGYHENGEISIEAAAREFCEETGVEGIVDASNMVILGERATKAGQLLVFVQNNRPLLPSQVGTLLDTDEVIGWQTITPDITLCFPFHEEVVKAWFTSIAAGVPIPVIPQVFR
jgi:ADP-ribose pyrophosphatase YjhB (NUDIX family)